MNLKILFFTIIIFNIYNDYCLGAEPYISNEDENTNDLRFENEGIADDRKLFLGFLGKIFKPIVRGIADAIAPPPPPPPPPPPQIVYQPHPQADQNAPTADVKPEKKEEPKKEEPKKEEPKKEEPKKEEPKKEEKDDSKDNSNEEEVDNGIKDDNDEDEEDDDDEED